MSEEDRVDFPRIYRDFHARVVAYAAKLIGRDDAEDVAQEVFAKISRSLDTLNDSSRLASWIYAITANTVRDTLRARLARHAEGPVPAPRGATPDTRPFEAADPRARTPEEFAARQEMVACYLDFVSHLPPEYQEVYVLCEVEHLTNAEIARRLRLPLGTVKIRLHRARARLHETLRRHCQCYYNERGELMGEPKRGGPIPESDPGIGALTPRRESISIAPQPESRRKIDRARRRAGVTAGSSPARCGPSNPVRPGREQPYGGARRRRGSP